MRPSSMAALAAELNLDLVARCGNRADPGPDRPDLQPRIAVQREDPVDRRDAAGRQYVKRAARHLLSGLEDQPDLAGQGSGRCGPREEQAGAEQDRGVHVVTARMADAIVQRTVRNALLVGDGQGIDVSTKRNCRGIIAGAADVAQQARALGQDGGPQPGRLKAQTDPAGRAVLRITDLWMSVQVPAKLDQLRLVALQKRL